MSSIIGLLAAHADKKDCENRRSPTKVPCFANKKKTHRHLTSIAVFTVHAETSQLFTFQRSMQANRNINLMVGKSTRLQVIPQQNTAKLPLQTYQKNQ